LVAGVVVEPVDLVLPVVVVVLVDSVRYLDAGAMDCRWLRKHCYHC
jgi:hypothetical protein